ncbi:MAG: hypothetical protein N4Q30_04420 [Neisseriaceae bacterium]|nr:hypothetical protein [Neisseriaceae bacterium]
MKSVNKQDLRGNSSDIDFLKLGRMIFIELLSYYLEKFEDSTFEKIKLLGKKILSFFGYDKFNEEIETKDFIKYIQNIFDSLENYKLKDIEKKISRMD